MCDCFKWFKSLDIKSNKTIDDLVDFYSSRGLRIPKDFISFYVNYNGVDINNRDNIFFLKVPECFKSRDKIIFDFICNVDLILRDSVDSEGFNFPIKMLSFVGVDDGDIVISLDERCFGNIFFCERDYCPEQMDGQNYFEYSIESVMKDFDYPNKSLPKVMFKISDTFTEFLDMIEIKHSS